MSTTSLALPEPEQRELETSLASLIARAQGIDAIRSPGDLTMAESAASDLRGYVKAVRENKVLGDLISKAYELHRSLTAIRNRFTDRAENEANRLGRLAGSYRAQL